jgi:hypothetical protein
MILTSVDYKSVGENVLIVETKKEYISPEAGEATSRILAVRKRFLTKKESLPISRSDTGLVRPQERKIC